MDLENVAIIAQIVVSVAVVLSLIFIGVQIRQSIKQNRINTVRNLVNQFAGFNTAISSDASFAEIWVKGLQDYERLNIAERARFSAHCSHLTQVFGELIELKKLSEIDDDSWKAYEKAFEMFVAYKGVQQWVETRTEWMTQDFKNYVFDKIKISKPINFYNE
jgi:hypothetical protein